METKKIKTYRDLSSQSTFIVAGNDKVVVDDLYLTYKDGYDLWYDILQALKENPVSNDMFNSVLIGVFGNDYLNSRQETNLEMIARLGSRYLSQYILENIYLSDTNGYFEKLTAFCRNAIALKLYFTYKTKWSKLYETLNLEYNPIMPFDIALNEESSDTLDSTDKRHRGYEYGNTSENQVAGFNSPDYSNSNKNEYVGKDTTDDNDTYHRTNPKTRNYTRKGNIGNIPQQELISKEREIAKFNLREVIINDVANFLCRREYCDTHC